MPTEAQLADLYRDLDPVPSPSALAGAADNDNLDLAPVNIGAVVAAAAIVVVNLGGAAAYLLGWFA